MWDRRGLCSLWFLSELVTGTWASIITTKVGKGMVLLESVIIGDMIHSPPISLARAHHMAQLPKRAVLRKQKARNVENSAMTIIHLNALIILVLRILQDGWKDKITCTKVLHNSEVLWKWTVCHWYSAASSLLSLQGLVHSWHILEAPSMFSEKLYGLTNILSLFDFLNKVESRCIQEKVTSPLSFIGLYENSPVFEWKMN